MEKFSKDPFFEDKELNRAEQELENKKNLVKSNIFKKIVEKGGDLGIDVTEIEKKLRGEDDETVRQILAEYLEEKRGQKVQTEKYEVKL